MKVSFPTLFNRAHRALMSGRYQVYSPAEKGFPYVETGFFIARDNKKFPLFRIGSSLIDPEKQKNIYVKRFNPAQNEVQARFNHVLVLTDDNCPYVPGRETKAYYFSHNDYLPDYFHTNGDLRKHHYRGWGYPEQDLSKDGFYAWANDMYGDVVNHAPWYRDTLKYIRDAIEIFASSVSK